VKPLAALLMAVLALASGTGCPREASTGGLPGAQLRRRLEAHMDVAAHRAELRGALSHYGLLFEIAPRDLDAFMTPIYVHRDPIGPVLGTAHGAEAHGGGVLALLLAHWRPDGRPARLDDRFGFAAGRQRLALEEIYRGHQRQVFLPVPGSPPEAIEGRLPETPQLPRMRFRYWTPAGFLETDAYKFLGLLLAHEEDWGKTWRNHLEQPLSVDRLLENARSYYLTNRSTEAEVADHTHLHLVELLLTYDRGHRSRSDPNDIKRRFLDVELSRESFEGEDGSEALAHYVESLGLLLADPRVSWQPEEARRVLEWLRRLERDRFQELAAVPIEHLAHLLKGLRRIEANGSRLTQARDR